MPASRKKTAVKKKSSNQEEEYSQEYEDRLREAYITIFSPNRKERIRGIEMYTDAVNAFPDDLLGYYQRAFAYEKLEKYNEALSDYEKCISLDPKNGYYYENCAVLLEKLGEYYPAICDFQNAVQLNPIFIEAETELGVSLFIVKLFEESEEQLTRVLAKEPDKLIAVMMRGLARKELENFNEALDDMKKAFSLDSGNELVKNDIAELEKKAVRSKKRKSGN